MNTISILLSLYIVSNAIEIDPTTNDQYVTVELTDDPRGENKINSANEWRLFQSWSDLIYDWGLVATFDGEEYSFKSNTDGSTLTIEIDGFCSSDQCDIFIAFSIGDEDYMVFLSDLDGGVTVTGDNGDGSSRNGIFIYPDCSGSIASGNAGDIYPSSDPISHTSLANDLAGGDADNYEQLTSSANNENFPLVFEFINNDVSDTFEFKFSSPTFSGNNALTCEYNSAVATGKDFKMYISPDGGAEKIKIKTITVDGIATGYTSDPTTSVPTSSQPTSADPTTSNPTTAEPTTSQPTTANPTTSKPTTSNPTTSVPTTATPTTSNPTTSKPTTSAPTTLEPTFNPTADPTLDGCDFNINAYLEQCYCTDVDYDEGQIGSPFNRYNNENKYKYDNYQGYDKMNRYNYNNEYYNGHDGNNNFLGYLNLFLNIIILIILGFLVSVHFGFCGRNNGENRYEKVYVYSDPEDAVKNALNQ